MFCSQTDIPEPQSVPAQMEEEEFLHCTAHDKAPCTKLSSVRSWGWQHLVLFVLK